MATLNKALVSDVLERISDLRGENTTNTNANRVRAISRQEQQLAKRFLTKLFLLPNQTTTGDATNTYTLGSATHPAHPKGLTEVFVGDDTSEGNRHQIVSFENFKDLYNRDNSTKLAYQYYDAANDAWKIYINPAPETGATITYSYFWLPPERTASSDSVYALDMEALARLALAEIYESEDEDDKAFDQRTIAEQIVDEAMGIEHMLHVGQNMTIGSYANTRRSRGIGAY